MTKTLRNHGKVCTISGKAFDATWKNFYVNRNSSDDLHPYHKYYDNVRRSTGISVDKLREIINFKNN